MQVRDIMTSDVTALTPGYPIADVAQMMRQLDVGSIPVVAEGKVLGIITDRDIVLRVVADGLDPVIETAEQHMTRDPIVAAPDWTLEHAADVMARAQVRRLPVVEDGRLVGYLALGDLAAQNRDRKVGDTLEEISEPTRLRDDQITHGSPPQRED